MKVQCELENPVDKYAIYLKTGNGATVGYLKNEKSGCFAKAIFYHLRSHPEANCTAKAIGKRFNLGDGEGWSSLYFPIYWRNKVCIDFERTIKFIEKEPMYFTEILFLFFLWSLSYRGIFSKGTVKMVQFIFMKKCHKRFNGNLKFKNILSYCKFELSRVRVIGIILYVNTCFQ